MSMEELLFQLQLEACEEGNNRVLEKWQEKTRLQYTPEVLAAQNRKKLKDLQYQTALLQNELKLKKQLEAERKRHAKAVLELKKANMTSDERRARDDETRRGRILFSNISAELHPDWRLHAEQEFQSRYAPRKKV